MHMALFLIVHVLMNGCFQTLLMLDYMTQQLIEYQLSKCENKPNGLQATISLLTKEIERDNLNPELSTIIQGKIDCIVAHQYFYTYNKHT